MSAGAWVVVASVVVAALSGAYRAVTDGRFRRSHATAPAPGAGSDAAGTQPAALWASIATARPDAHLGDRATLVQFSSAFCTPCRATRRVLSEVAEVVPGVVHLEIDAEHHLELTRSLGVLRTPTTIVLDSRGSEITRAAGAPRKEQVLAALGGIG